MHVSNYIAQSRALNRLKILIAGLLLAGCTGVPDGVRPVKNFELENYLGKWYEIARLDHSFERGMNFVTATYTMRDDGGVRVLNRGFKSDLQQWSEAEGKAYFVETPDLGHLKVSFFGPFYGSYVIFEIGSENYDYAFVSGMNTDYLWLLSRSPEVDEKLLDLFRSRAKSLGFKIEDLIMVDQSE